MSRPEPPIAASSTVLAGIAFMLVGTSIIPVMNAFAKSLAGEFVPWQITWARFAGHLLLMTLVLVPRRGFGVYRSNRPGLQLTRSTIFFVSNACFITALQWISLATASAIIFTVPMLVTVLSVVFLGERIGLWRWGAVLAGFVGAMVIVQPGTEGFEPATLLVLASATCYAVYQLLTRRLTAHDSADTQILYTALVGAVVTSFIVPFVGRMPETSFQVVSFLAIGCIGATAHLLVIQALRRAPASVVAPIGYVELIGATALGYLVFGDWPGPATWVGAALIVVSGLVIAWREGGRTSAGASRAAARFGPEALIVAGAIAIAVGAALHFAD